MVLTQGYVDGVDWVVELANVGGANGVGMWGESKVCQPGSKCITAMMGMSIPPASSSTIMHQVLRLRDTLWRKCIDIIAQYASQSTHPLLSLSLSVKKRVGHT